jgi:hypothetical protein
MGPARSLHAFSAAVGETRVGTAGVVLASTTAEQLIALQAVNQACEPAARELDMLGEVAHAHPARGRVHQVLEYLIGAELQPVLAL